MLVVHFIKRESVKTIFTIFSPHPMRYILSLFLLSSSLNGFTQSTEEFFNLIQRVEAIKLNQDSTSNIVQWIGFMGDSLEFHIAKNRGVAFHFNNDSSRYFIADFNTDYSMLTVCSSGETSMNYKLYYNVAVDTNLGKTTIVEGGSDYINAYLDGDTILKADLLTSSGTISAIPEWIEVVFYYDNYYIKVESPLHFGVSLSTGKQKDDFNDYYTKELISFYLDDCASLGIENRIGEVYYNKDCRCLMEYDLLLHPLNEEDQPQHHLEETGILMVAVSSFNILGREGYDIWKY